MTGGRAIAQYPGQIWDGSTPTRTDPGGDNLDIWRKPDAGDYAQVAAEILGIQNQLETGYQYDTPINFVAASTISVANDVDSGWKIIPRACKVIKCFGAIKTAATGTGSAQFDIKFSTDNGSTWTSLWATTTANKPAILVTTHTITQTSFDTLTLAEGTLLRLDVLVVGGTIAGSGLSVTLLTRAVK